MYKNVRLAPLMLIVFFLTLGTIFFVWYIFPFIHWMYLLWFECLLTFVWFDGFVMPFISLQQHRKTIGSGFLIMTPRVMATSAASFTLLGISFLVAVLLPDWQLLQYLHIILIVIQIIFFVVFFAKALNVAFGQKMQQDGLEEIPVNLPKPGDLALDLNLCASKTPAALQKRLSLLVDTLKYSLLAWGKIAGMEEYSMLVAAIEKLTRSLRTDSGNTEDLLEQAERLAAIVKQKSRITTVR